ncbi:MAG: EamA family transporter, partial [Candidatus Magasanikbacteria bacterium]|nr:EamA family transporter [Candidatus Magasanikbacteria bacterium]
ILFFQEKLNLQQSLLTALIFCGIFLATLKAPQSKFMTFFSGKTWIEKGVFFAIGAVLVISLINFFTVSNARLTSPLLAIWFPWTILAVSSLTFIFLKKDYRRSFLNLKKNFPIVLLMCIANCIAWVSFSYSSTKINFSILSAIALAYPLIAILLGIFVNKEKIIRIQAFGIGVALFGSLLIGLFFK